MSSSLLSLLSFSFSPSLPPAGGGTTSDEATPPSDAVVVYGPGLMSEEGEGLLEVELEVETGGEMTLGDLTGGDVGDGEVPAGGSGLSWSWSRWEASCLSFASSLAACFASLNMSTN